MFINIFVQCKQWSLGFKPNDLFWHKWFIRIQHDDLIRIQDLPNIYVA